MKGGPTAEHHPQQRIIMLGASVGFIGLLVVPALDFRFGWSAVPLAGVLLGDALFVVGFGFIGLPREHAHVRHRRSFAASARDLDRAVRGRPASDVRKRAPVPDRDAARARLVPWLLPLAVMLPFLVWRLIDQERVLARELPGYTHYQARVRYRLVPHVW
jgi:hypothetical protein